MKNKSLFYLVAAVIAAAVVFGCSRSETVPDAAEQPSFEESRSVEQPLPAQPEQKEQRQPAPKAEQQAQAEASKAPAREIMVTFVELGSVNCIPCKMMQPVMDEIEKEYGDRVEVVFHDVWTAEGRPYGQKYRVRAIPTQVFLDKDGNEFFRHEGFFPKEEIVKVLKTQGVE